MVAASGGIDSTVLAHALVEVGQPIVLAHIDHGLREDSHRDGAFVEEQAAHLGVEAERIAVTVEPGNVQAQARRARYAALAEAAHQRTCRWVATGHTATDQAETVLMALMRGAGLRGLAGMPERRALAEAVGVVRPMLQVSRADVEAAAAEGGWAWREDPSNAGDAYRRNRLRQTVLPLLRDEGGADVDARIAASAQGARGGLDLIGTRVLPDSGPLLPLDALAGLPPDAQRVLLAEALARWAPRATRSSALVDRVRQLIDGGVVGAQVASGGVRVWRERGALRIEPYPSGVSQSSAKFSYDVPSPWGEGQGEGLRVGDRGSETRTHRPPHPSKGGEGTASSHAVVLAQNGAGTLTATPLAAVPGEFGADPLSEIVDLDQAGSVTLRLWQHGDRIRPLGMDGSTLVSDLLRQRGVPRALRAGVPVVVCGDRVLWVVGHRLAASVAVRPETMRAARWTWRPAGGAG